MLKLLRIGQAILLCGAQSFIGLAVNLVHCGLPFGKHFAHGLVKKFLIMKNNIKRLQSEIRIDQMLTEITSKVGIFVHSENFIDRLRP